MDDLTLLLSISTGFIVLIIISTLVKKDAEFHRISIDGKPYSTNNGAWAWFGSCILLLIAALPYYLYERSKVLGERRRAATPPVHPAAAVSRQPSDVEQEIRKLALLKQDGLISETDYEQKKNQLLGL